MWKKANRSEAYAFSYRPGDPDDDRFLRHVRAVIRAANRTHPQRLRVSLSPSGIAKEHAWKYDNRFKRRVKIEDAREVDVYVSVVPEGGVRRAKSSGPRLPKCKAVSGSKKA